MHLLDRPTTRLAFDRQHVYNSIEEFPDQIRQAWAESRRIRLPASYRTAKAIVVVGMGGSGWPAKIVRTLFTDRIRVPMTVVNDYRLPAWVDRNTLVLASSYSGTTEEPLAAARSAKTRGAKLVALTLGGPLARLAKAWHIPRYQFIETHNPSHQPRMGAGYMIFGTAGLLAATGYLRIPDGQVEAAVQRTTKASRGWGADQPYARNKAKRLAVLLQTRLPLLIASEHLEATAEAFRNRINENAKHFAAWFPIPDLNHHLLEGLAHPRFARQLMGVFLLSDHYDPRNQRRHAVTQTVFRKYGIPTFTFRAGGLDRIEDALRSLAFSGYVSYWLALLHRVDPSKIPWVDYFKRELAKGRSL